jgi:hypothetical protein
VLDTALAWSVISRHFDVADFIVEFPNEVSAIRFERYLKTGSGGAFAKRHFGPK